MKFTLKINIFFFIMLNVYSEKGIFSKRNFLRKHVPGRVFSCVVCMVVRKGERMLNFYLSLIDNEEDRNLFEKIYYSHRKQMLVLAMSILENEDDAEDLVHDVFCAVAEKHIHILHTITNEQDLKNYLLKATKNRALNMKRDRKYHMPLYESEEALISEESMNDSSFLDAICEKLAYEELVTAIKGLDKKYEEVLYLHFVLELSVNDVGEILNRNTYTVKKQLSRGKKLLLESLEGVKK